MRYITLNNSRSHKRAVLYRNTKMPVLLKVQVAEYCGKSTRVSPLNYYSTIICSTHKSKQLKYLNRYGSTVILGFKVLTVILW